MTVLRVDTIAASGQTSENTGSVFFDGTGDYLNIPNNTQFEVGEDFTFETWIYRTSLGSLNTIYSYLTAGTTLYGLSFILTTTGIGIYGYNNGSSSYDALLTISGVVTANEWHHVAVVRSSNTWYYYIDGVLQGSGTMTSFSYSGTPTFYIGYQNDNYANSFAGYLSNYRILKGTALYTSNFTPPTTELEVTPETVLVCCHDGENIFAEKTGKIIAAYGDRSSGIHTVGESPIGITTFQPGLTRSVDVTAGPTLDGDLKFNSQNFFVLPKGTTTDRNQTGGRAVNTRGFSSGENNVIEYTTISSMGNAIDFGDLTDTYYSQAGGSDVTRGVFLGGYNGNATPDTDINVIEYITFATTGNAVDFGDTHVGRYQGAVSSPTRILSAGGNAPRVTTIDFITTQTLGSTASFGNLTESARGSFAGCCQSPTRGVICGGQNTSGTTVNDIQYVTMASEGDSVDFGDLIEAASNNAGGSASSSTRGIIFHGYDNSAVTNVISYITIATTGSNTNFGDLTEARQDGMSASSTTRGMFIGGRTPTRVNTIDYVNISSTGNAQDFGDMTGLGAQGAACSDSHGGL